MTCTRLSARLATGFEESLRQEALLASDQPQEEALASVPLRELPRLVRSAVPYARRDELLAAIVRCYRRSPHPGWSGVLLEALAPALVRVCRRMIRVPRGIDADDVEQQVVLEALRAARSMPLHEPPRRVERRIELRVTTMTVRWLVSDVRSQGEELVDAQPDTTSRPSKEDRLLLAELRERGVPAESLALLYRSQVLGQTFAELAVELGISPDAVRKRQRRAVERLRRTRPDLFGRLADDLRPAA